MDRELVQLQERVAELEAALARRSGGFAAVGILGAGIVAVGLVATLAAQGPSKVVAPFEVVDSRGRTIFKIQMSASGAGLGIFFDDKGQEVAIIGHASGSELPTIRVMDKGIDKVGLGISKGDGLVQVGNDVDDRIQIVSGVDAKVSIMNKSGQVAASVFKTAGGDGAMDINTGGKIRVALGISGAGEAGLLTLFSNTTKAQTVLHGDAGLQHKNAQGLPVAQLSVDDNGHGSVMVASRMGTFMSKLSIATDGSSGRVEVSAGGEVKALMGILSNGKGDVCANGDKGSACLSQVNLKY